MNTANLIQPKSFSTQILEKPNYHYVIQHEVKAIHFAYTIPKNVLSNSYFFFINICITKFYTLKKKSSFTLLKAHKTR